MQKKTTASKFRHIMSAVGTTLLQSPGWNEGKARYVTLGIHRQKRIELRRSGTNRASISFALWFVPPRWGSTNVFQWLTQGLRPGLCRSIALTGLLYVLPIKIYLRPLHALKRGLNKRRKRIQKKGTAPKINLDTVPYNWIRPLWGERLVFLYATKVWTITSIDFYELAFSDEERHTHLSTRF